MNEMFCAEKGNGAYLNNSRIRVSKQKKIKNALIVTGGPKGASKIKDKIFSEYISVSKNVSNVRKFGSAALDIAYVACADLKASARIKLLEGRNNNFERSCVVLIFEQANTKKNILATNFNIHQELGDLIKKIY